MVCDGRGRLLAHAIRTGELAQLEDEQVSKTIYMPGTAPVVTRELGPRTLQDVPLSELKMVFEQLSVDSSASFDPLRLAELYGLSRLTGPEIAHVEQALAYSWRG